MSFTITSWTLVATRTYPIPAEPQCRAACDAQMNAAYPGCETTEAWSAKSCGHSCRCKLQNGSHITGYSSPGSIDRYSMLIEREQAIKSMCRKVAAELGREEAATGHSSQCTGLLLAAVRALQLRTRATRCALLMVGDSMSAQAWAAARCALRDLGGVTIATDANRSVQVLRQQPEYAGYARAYRSAYPGWGGDVSEHSELTFRFGKGPDTNAEPLDLLLLRLQRAGSRVRGPGVMGKPSLFLALLDALGPCTIVLYSEGLHHGSGLATQSLQESHYRISVRQALNGLLSASAAIRASGGVGKADTVDSWAVHAPVVAVWETVAQHFATTDGSGEYEEQPGFNRSAGVPLMQYYLTKGFKYAEGSCVMTTSGYQDWRNVLLREQVLRLPDHGGSASARAVWLPGFHASSQAWGPLLHTQRGDCTHTWCYTPYFFAQLWMSLATALADL